MIMSRVRLPALAEIDRSSPRVCRSVESNALTAMRKAQNKTAKLGVHRTSVMPNKYLLVKKMNLFRGGLDSGDMVSPFQSSVARAHQQCSTCSSQSNGGRATFSSGSGGGAIVETKLGLGFEGLQVL
jgi:hypothetical protein